MPVPVDVVIVGAGAAGIGAARTLHKAGVSCIVLEARDRIGGRAWTEGGFELGAEFIHGENACTIALAKEVGVSVYEVFRYGQENWGKPPAKERVLHEIYKRLMCRDPNTVPPSVSLWDGFREEDPTLDEADKRSVDVLFCLTWATSSSDISLRDMVRDSHRTTNVGGSREFCLVEGYSELFRRLAQGLDIRTSAEVVAIRWHDAGCVVHCRTGPPLRAKHCILTCPPPVLRELSFSPPLPEDKTDAMQRSIRMWPGTKVMVEFSPGVQLWDCSRLQYWVTVQGVAGRWWSHRRTGMQQGASIAAFLTAGDADVYDGLSETQMEGRILSELADLTATPLHKLRVAVSRIVRVSWGADAWARGCYCAVAPCASEAEPRLALAAPCGPLGFAGEATAHDADPQTVHGAWDTGVREAVRVLRALSPQQSKL